MPCRLRSTIVVAFLLLSSSLSMSQASEKVPPINVRAKFAAALALEKQGKTEQALRSYQDILRIYPDYQPAIIQSARILYRYDRIPEAHALFRRIDPVGFDLMVSYEYAMSHFWMRDYDRALYGFKRIPEGNALYDLASYYGGIAALKLRRLVEAEVMLERAVVLPDKLVASRKRFLRHVQLLKDLYEEKSLKEERIAERKKIEQAIQDEDAVKLAPNSAELYVRRYSHEGFELVKIAALLGWQYKNQQTDNHGYAKSNTSLSTPFLDIFLGKQFALPFKYGKHQAAIGFQLNGRAEQQQRSGTETRNEIHDNVDDIQRITTEIDTNRYQNSALASGSAFVEFPVYSYGWWSLGGAYQQRHISADEVTKSSKSSVRTRGGINIDRDWIYTEYEFSSLTGDKNKLQQKIHQISAVGDGTLQIGLGLEGTLRHRYFEYVDQTLDGPTSVSSIELRPFYQLPLNLRMGLVGGYSLDSQHVFTNVPSYEKVSADGSSIMGGAFVRAEPVRWFRLELSHTITQTTWAIDNEDARESFEQTIADMQQSFMVTASLDLLF